MTVDEEEHELVMPFLPVVSRGGPYDDEAFVAGFQVGQLDAQLAARPVSLIATILGSLREQADLLAMRHDCTLYTCGGAHGDIHSDEWLCVEFLRPDPSVQAG